MNGQALPLSKLKVLALSHVGGYGGFNTSVHRIRGLQALGCEVEVVDSALPAHAMTLSGRLRARMFRHGLDVRGSDPARDLPRLMLAARRRRWDVLWLEKALTIDREAIADLRSASPGMQVVGFSPDDMAARHNQSLQFLSALPAYDCFLTTKSFNVAELQQLGCRHVVVVGNGYDPEAFRPVAVSHAEVEALGGDVGFIGTFEAERAQAVLSLARNGVPVRVWGSDWERMRDAHVNLRIEGRPLYGDDFAKACGAFKINLGFLRKLNRDQQTTRSVEIPASGGFMLAERTAEHAAMFVEGEEAEFFASSEELLHKCRRYLAAPELRARIANAGRVRCLSSGYDNATRLQRAMLEIPSVRKRVDAGRGSPARLDAGVSTT